MTRILVNILFLLSANSIFSQNIIFDYPFTREDDKWNSYTSVQERLQALQIPDSVINHIPTKDLLEICINYPYYLDFIFAESIEEGLNMLENEFNGFKELLSREDLFSIVLAKEKERSDILKNTSRDLSEIDCVEFSMKTLLVDAIYMHGLSRDTNKEIQKAFYSFYSDKKNAINLYPMIFGSMYKSGLESLITNNNLEIPVSVFDNPLQMASDGWESVNLYTPKGTLLSYTYKWVGPEVTYSVNDSIYLSNYIISNYNGAQLLRMPTNKYNCHGYAWSVSEGGEKAWVGLKRYQYFDESEVVKAEDSYWLDGSYIEVPEVFATKVSYHESGNHSAVRESNNWYISKWGDNALVRHHPNDVPSIYNPLLTKKYYLRDNFNIIGSNVLCGSQTYSVSNLPEGASVIWSLTSGDTLYTTLQVNFPQVNQCCLTHNNVNFNSVTLNAEILMNGQTVKTIQKIVNKPLSFSGTYEQLSCSDYGFTTPAISPTSIPNNRTMYVYVGGIVTLTSEYFKFKDIITSGPFGNFHFIGGNQIRFNLVPLNVTQPFVIKVVEQNCDDEVLLTFYSCPIGNNYSLSISSCDSQTYKLRLLQNVIESNKTTETSSISRTNFEETDNIKSWNLEVFNASTMRKKISLGLREPSYVINTIGWEKGIYIVNVIIDKQVLTEKITVN